MDAMVEKKFAKLKNIANQYCKESVKEELQKVEAKRFKDIYVLTDWFVKLAGVRQDVKFKESLLKFEYELKNWIEAYKYLKPNESPDYIPIIDTILEVYDKVEFYSKDPNKEIDIDKNISFKLIIVHNKNTAVKEIIKAVQAKKQEMMAKNEEHQRHAVAQQPATVVTTQRPQQVRPPPPPQPNPSSTVVPQVRAPEVQKAKPPPRKEPQPQIAQPKANRSHPPPPPVSQPVQMQIEPPVIPTPPKATPQPEPTPPKQTINRRQPASIPANLSTIRPTEIEKDVSSLVQRPITTKPIRERRVHDQNKAIAAIIKDMDFLDTDRKEVVNLLVQQLNNHMKNLISKVVKFARIHNPNNNRFGDEFKVFGKANELRGKFDLPLDAKVRVGFYKIKQPNKLSIYSTLRNFEEREEQKLRVEDTKKRKDNEREIMQFVRGSPRTIKQHIFNEQNTMSDRLTIKLAVVQTVLELDPFYCDSEILRRSYMS